MKVIVPDKLKEKVSEALTELYLFRQAIESGLIKSNEKIVERIEKIKALLQKNVEEDV
tara:strand:- start:776 stop:949 length:174 start_codon:yes stop_codon:yes gene_type:complete